MKIVIAGGRDQADFLIGSLLSKKHRLVIINENADYCGYLSEKHKIAVTHGDPCKKYILDEAQINSFDVMIALTQIDADNLAICQTAKRLFGIKKAVCTVVNPKNVDVFKKLGVNVVISATFMVAKFIEQVSTVENLIKTMSIEDDKVIMSEIVVDSGFYCVNKTLSELSFPNNAIVSCVLRGTQMIIPNGSTMLRPDDRLFIISSPENQRSAISAISEKPAEARKSK